MHRIDLYDSVDWSYQSTVKTHVARLRSAIARLENLERALQQMGARHITSKVNIDGVKIDLYVTGGGGEIEMAYDPQLGLVER